MSPIHSTSLVLIRHGQSEANAGLLMDDHTQTPLTPLGHQQAQNVANPLPFLHPNQTPDLIVTSPFLRAQQTSLPTRARFPQTPLETWPIHEFTYLAAARYTQTTLDERMPFILDYWHRAEPDTPDGPGAESFHTFLDRVETLFTQARQHPAQTIVAFSHGNFMRGVLWRILCGSLEHARANMTHFNLFYRSIPVANTSALHITLHPNDPLNTPTQLHPTSTTHIPSDLLTL